MLDFNVQNLKNIENLDEYRKGNFFAYNDYIKVFELLEKYGYEKRVVDPETGVEWKSKEVMYNEFKRVKEKAIEKRLIRYR